MQITDNVMQLLGVAKSFTESSARINSLDFHRSGDILVTGGDDDTIHTYSTTKGTHEAKVQSKKYGVCNIRCTPFRSSVLYSSPEFKIQGHVDPTWFSIRRHDLDANVYDLYFKGHTDLISTLATCPATEAFMSASLDKTLRLWDLRTSICQGLVEVGLVPCGAFDHQGLVFALSSDSRGIRLFDMRAYQRGPFFVMEIPDELKFQSSFSSLQFSPNGRYILSVVEGRVYVMDAYDGTVVCKFDTSLSSDMPPPMEATFSPDSKYVVAGRDDGSLLVWNLETNRKVATLLHGRQRTPSRVAFAPGQLLMASACNTLNLWTPPLKIFDLNHG